MTTLSDMLSEALSGPTRTRSPSIGDGYVVSPDLHEAVDEWMREFMRQVQMVAPKYEAYLKKMTGRGFKLFRTFVTDNGRIRVRFDPSKKNAHEFGPMIVLRVAYSKSADLYNVEVEVYGPDISQKLASDEVTDVDVDLLADPQRMFFGVREAISQLGKKTGAAASNAVSGRARERAGEKAEGLVGELGAILSEARGLSEGSDRSTALHYARSLFAMFRGRKPLSKDLWASADSQIKLLKKLDLGRAEGELESLADSISERDVNDAGSTANRFLKAIEELDEARLSPTAQGATFDNERSNPTATGPSAERTRTLKTASAGIERMLQAIEVIRGMVRSLGIGAKDKTGAAAAALKIAAAEIAKVEEVQSMVSSIIELPGLDGDAIARLVDEAVAEVLSEKRMAPSMDASRAKEGLAKLVDGLRQLHGMLRQAKVTGRVLDQVEAAINGLKATRDAIEALAECNMAVAGQIGANDIPYGKFEPTSVSDIGKGWWVTGGHEGEQFHRKVREVSRNDRFTIIYFEEPYVGADGEKRVSARFPNEMRLRAAKG